MNVKNKVQNMSAMRRVVMAAAFAAGLWDRRDLYLSSHSGTVAYSPKRTKLKGWQKAARK